MKTLLTYFLVCYYFSAYEYYVHHYVYFFFTFFHSVDPATPGAITVLETTQTKVRFAWSAASGYFDFYRINLFPNGSDPVLLQELARGSDLIISKNYLEPDTLYTIQIYAVTGDTQSAVREAPARTGTQTCDLSVKGLNYVACIQY